MLDMHSTGLRVVGAWLFAIVLILFSTVFVHVPYTREIQMVLAIPVLLFFGAPFYAGAWKGTRSGRNNIDRLVALTTSYGAQNETYIEGWEKKTSNLLIYKRLCKV